MAALADTNILVYGFDPRFPTKKVVARDLLRRGLVAGDLHLPHQALVEFVSAVRKPVLPGTEGLLSASEALREVEAFLTEFPVLYPDATLLRTAVRGFATYRLSWFDAHLWAYAERFGLDTIYSEDFVHGGIYGAVRVVNPFLGKSA